MKTLIGFGTALTIAASPLALKAEPRFEIGGEAVLQVLNAAIAAQDGDLREAEAALRQAARDAGVSVGLRPTEDTAGPEAAEPVATAAAQAAPAPRLAPVSVGQRPRLRPEIRGFASLDTVAEIETTPAFETATGTPPVTTVRDGVRVATSAVDTDITPLRRPATLDTSAGIEGPKTVSVEETAVREDSALPAMSAGGSSNASFAGETTLFAGPTGY